MDTEELRREKFKAWQEYAAAIKPFQEQFEKDTAPLWEGYLKAEAELEAKYREAGA